MQLYLEIVGKDKLNKHKMSELARMIRFAVNDDYDTILYGGYDPTIVSSIMTPYYTEVMIQQLYLPECWRMMKSQFTAHQLVCSAFYMHWSP